MGPREARQPTAANHRAAAHPMLRAEAGGLLIGKRNGEGAAAFTAQHRRAVRSAAGPNDTLMLRAGNCPRSAMVRRAEHWPSSAALVSCSHLVRKPPGRACPEHGLPDSGPPICVCQQRASDDEHHRGLALEIRRSTQSASALCRGVPSAAHNRRRRSGARREPPRPAAGKAVRAEPYPRARTQSRSSRHLPRSARQPLRSVAECRCARLRCRRAADDLASCCRESRRRSRPRVRGRQPRSRPIRQCVCRVRRATSGRAVASVGGKSAGSWRDSAHLSLQVGGAKWRARNIASSDTVA